jgi:hypothetical protein
MKRVVRAAAAILAMAAPAVCAPASALDLSGKAVNPFATRAQVRVLLFVRTDCPITNRYAPELQKLAEEFRGRDVRFWLIYPDRTETAAGIRKHMAEYHFPGEPLRDPEHLLVARARATVAPEAAVFNAAGDLVYHGRIDDWYVDIGRARAAAQRHDLRDAIQAVLDGRRVAEPETRAVGCSLADVE